MVHNKGVRAGVVYASEVGHHHNRQFGVCTTEVDTPPPTQGMAGGHRPLRLHLLAPLPVGGAGWYTPTTH